MKLTRTSDGYVVQIPDDVVKALGLREGDTVKVSSSSIVERLVDEDARARAIDTMRRLAKPLPPGYKFDREEANAR